MVPPLFMDLRADSVTQDFFSFRLYNLHLFAVPGLSSGHFLYIKQAQAC